MPARRISPVALLSAAALEGGTAWQDASSSMHATLKELSAEFPGGGTATLSLPRGDGCRFLSPESKDSSPPAEQLLLRWRPGSTNF